MVYAFLLSKQNIQLSRDELSALASKVAHHGDWSLADVSPGTIPRFAYVKLAVRVLISCAPDRLEAGISNYDWASLLRGSFSIRKMGRSPLSEKDAASLVHSSAPEAKVDLKSPKFPIIMAKAGERMIVGLLEYENPNEFMGRKAHLRPGFSPVSLDPRLARACVNLTSIRPGQTLIDPFCGTGGVIIEAAMMGINTTGIDMDALMVHKCALNLEYFNIEADILQGDALGIKGKFDHMVTDLPYGLSSRLSSGLTELYHKFMRKSIEHVRGTSVVMFPSFVDHKEFLHGWEEVASYEHYLHKNLTKRIVVIKARRESP